MRKMPRRGEAPPEDDDAIEATVVNNEEEEEQEPTRPRRLPRRRPAASQTEDDDDNEEEEEETPRRRLPRRRPPLKEETDDEDDYEEDKEDTEDSDDEEEEEAPKPAAKKRRGRPRKAVDDDDEEEPTPKKKRRRKGALATQDNQLAKKPNSWIEGDDLDQDDFEIPGIKVLHPMSPDAEDMPEAIGHWVLNKEIDLGKEIEIILLHVKKQRQEILPRGEPFDEDNPPEIFDSLDEAREAGVKTRPCAVVDMAVILPEGLEDEALNWIDDLPLMPCRFYLRGGYKKFIGPLNTHFLKGVDREKWDRIYSVKAVKRKSGTGRNWDPVLRPTDQETSKEIRAFAKKFSA